jgi:electron transport complex protein RnfB
MQSVVAKSMIALTSMAAVFGAVLAFASRIFAVHRDPRVEHVLDLLPGANCGACGFPGCQGLAEAMVKGEALPNACPPGGAETAAAIAELLGGDAGDVVPRIAVVHCKGGLSNSVQRLDYEGIEDCRAALLVGGNPKACIFGCLGFGTCKAVFPFDAVELDEEGLVHIDRVKCTRCGNCVVACPVNACIACQLCVKKCPSDAIYMDDNLAVIDYSKCTNCGVCAAVCPTNAIVDEIPARPKAVIGGKCEGVGKCKEVCPVKAIEGEPGERHEIIREKCIGCGLCMEACPTKAVNMVGALGHQRAKVGALEQD